MKIDRNKPSPAKAGTIQSTRGQATKSQATQSQNAPSPVDDHLSIAGIPEAEITPKVQTALENLMAEVSALRTRVNALEGALEQARMLADHDPLLDIANRRAFVRDLTREQAMSERYQTDSALVYIDLNDLKIINDTHGHAAGDAALKHLTSLLKRHIRAVDSFGRLGGDEFGLILNNATIEIAQRKVSQLQAIIAQHPLEWKGQTFTLNIACGIVDIKAGLSIEETLDSADRAMYADKKRTDRV